MMLVSGNPNEAVHELWKKTQRSFNRGDGYRRRSDVYQQMVSVTDDIPPRFMVYPGRDERVLRVVRKIVRGLSHHHGLLSPVSDRQVWCNVYCFQTPPAFASQMTVCHIEKDVFKYSYSVLDDGKFHSWWELMFYERTPFIGIVHVSESR